jgi:arginine decarboxylase
MPGCGGMSLAARPRQAGTLGLAAEDMLSASIGFMRDLDTPEIHDYLPNFGYRVNSEKAIEIASESAGSTANGHRRTVRTAAPSAQKAPKRMPARRGGSNGDRNLPEVGQDELLGEQQPGDALTAAAPPGDQGVTEVVVEELTGERYPGAAVQADAGS